MIWVTWRQHRTHALICLGLLSAIAVLAVALGVWMRSAFSADGLGACLAHSGGAACPEAISSFSSWRWSPGASSRSGRRSRWS